MWIYFVVQSIYLSQKSSIFISDCYILSLIMHTNQKRFDYNISSHSTQHPKTNHQFRDWKKPQNTILSMSPIQNRSLIDASFQDRQRQTPFYAGSKQFEELNYDRYQEMVNHRTRASSYNGSHLLPRNRQMVKMDHTHYKDNRANQPYSKPFFNQQKQVQSRNFSKKKGSYSRPVQKQTEYIEQINPNSRKPSNALKENTNHLNIRSNKIQIQVQKCENIKVELEQRELMQKIDRIARLNSQINNRLLSMLSKIDKCE